MNIKKLNGTILNLICCGLWVIPLFFFVKDFFNFSELDYSYLSKLKNIGYFSIKQAFYSSVIALLVALLPAYYSAYKKNSLTTLLNGLMFIPFFFPVISVVTIFSIVFNLEFFKHFEILYSLKAIIIANVFYNSPIFVKYISEGLKKIPKELNEAMELDGASKVKIFVKGQIPLIMPQIFRAFILTFTYCFLGFGIVLSLGGINYTTLEVELATTLVNGSDFSNALIIGGVQIFILIFLNLLGYYIKEYEFSTNPRVEKVSPFITFYTILYALIQYGVVFFSLGYSFINLFTGKISFYAYKNLFSKDFSDEYHIVESLWNSTKLSMVVSFITVIFVYLIIKNYNRLTDVIIFSNFGLSGAFLAIILYYMYVLFDISLYVLLVVGYLISTVPIAYSFMYQYIKKFPIDVYESSLLDCKNSFQRILYVELPILKNILLSAFLQVFAVVFGEFSIVYTMQLEDIYPTAPLVNYALVSNKKYMESSAFTTIVIVIILFAFILGEYLKKED